MKFYKKPDITLWTGRQSNDEQLYFHEKIQCIDLEHDQLTKHKEKAFTILGYACDKGVQRNQGRIGTKEGPKMIRKMLAPLANHFEDQVEIFDVGDIICEDSSLELSQSKTSDIVSQLILNQMIAFILGGSHDLAYAHYNGLKKQLKNKTIGVINLDAHFDLREVINQGNSGTPFYQIAQENDSFYYLCLGIQKANNDQKLFKTADQLGVRYLDNIEFNIDNLDTVKVIIHDFIASVDHIYLTIDMDGFSSIHAPGVSAPSPFGFSIDIALETIKLICKSGKLISTDVVELNPKYDIDNCTAKLAARIIYQMMSWI